MNKYRGAARNRFPQEEERVLREEEEILLRQEEQRFMQEDTRGEARRSPPGDCHSHPERSATAACAECGRNLCSDCIYASGGGHSFCRDCMEASRLVEAGPEIHDKELESADEGTAAGVPVVIISIAVVLALLMFLAIAFVFMALLAVF